jgi:hypothetical protein
MGWREKRARAGWLALLRFRGEQGSQGSGGRTAQVGSSKKREAGREKGALIRIEGRAKRESTGSK